MQSNSTIIVGQNGTQFYLSLKSNIKLSMNEMPIENYLEKIGVSTVIAVASTSLINLKDILFT